MVLARGEDILVSRRTRLHARPGSDRVWCARHPVDAPADLRPLPRFGSDGVLPRPPARAFTWSVFSFTRPTVRSCRVDRLVVRRLRSDSRLAQQVGRDHRVHPDSSPSSGEIPWVFNSGDTLIRIEALFLALAPCGAALVARPTAARRILLLGSRTDTTWPFACCRYSSRSSTSPPSSQTKGETWQDGTAVAYSLRQRDLLMIPAPGWVTESLLVLRTR